MQFDTNSLTQIAANELQITYIIILFCLYNSDELCNEIQLIDAKTDQVPKKIYSKFIFSNPCPSSRYFDIYIATMRC